VHVILSVAVLFQDFLELLESSIYRIPNEKNKCGNRDVPYCSGVSSVQAVQASRLLAASAEIGPLGKSHINCGVRVCTLSCLSLAMAPFAVRCFSVLPWIGQAPISRSGALRRGEVS
jgi:hypothetical protein